MNLRSNRKVKFKKIPKRNYTNFPEKSSIHMLQDMGNAET